MAYKKYLPEKISVRELASKYVIGIKEVQADGPYHIVGGCIGGIIAYEVVSQLESKGDHVNLLALMDSPASEKKGKVEIFRLRWTIYSFTNSLPSFSGNISSLYNYNYVFPSYSSRYTIPSCSLGSTYNTSGFSGYNDWNTFGSSSYSFYTPTAHTFNVPDIVIPMYGGGSIMIPGYSYINYHWTNYSTRVNYI